MSHLRSSIARLRLPALLVVLLATSSYAALVVYKTTRPFVSTKLTLDSSTESAAPIEILSPAEAVATAVVPDGAKLTVFAAEPDVGQPIALAFDDRGRLWVAECRSYRYAVHGAPPAEAVDRIVVLEDVDGDGRHDRRTVFAEGLKNLSGLEIGWGGVWACCAPELLFLPDADRDLRPDGKPITVLDGFDARPELSWHLPNHLVWGPDGKLYGCSGFSSRSRPGKPGTPNEKRAAIDAGVWRVDPQSHDFEVVARGTCNPWGLDFDSAGRLLVSNNVVDHLWQIRTGGHYERWEDPSQAGVYEALGSCVDHHHWSGDDKWDHGRAAQVGGGHAHAGLLIYQGGMWPDAYREAVLVGNIHGRRICADRFEYPVGLAVARHSADLVRMADPGFRAVDIKCGPDGDVYFCDWSSIGECHSTDTWDVDALPTGRVYKLSFGAKVPAEIDLAKLSVDELLQLQTHRNDWYARQARVRLHHLASQGKLGVELAAQAWSQARDGKRSATERLRCLWTWNLTVPRERRAEAVALAGDADVMVRCWALRIAVDGDAVSPRVVAALCDGAKRFDEPEFVMELSSLAGRLPPTARRELLPILLPKLHDGLPRDQQRLAWYALEPILLDDLTWSTEQSLRHRGTFLALAATRRLAEAWTDAQTKVDRAALIASIARLLEAEGEPKVVAARIVGLRDGAAGSEQPVPEAWIAALNAAAKSDSAEVRAATDSLAWELLYADRASEPAVLLAVAISTAESPTASAARRSAALTYCIARRGDAVLALLLRLSDDPDAALACRAIQGLAAFDDRAVPAKLLERWKSWDEERRAAALDVLSSRVGYADHLITALELDRFAASDVPAGVAMRLATIGGGKYAERVAASWGSIRPLRHELEAQHARLHAVLAKPGQVDPVVGAKLFTKLCAGCHNFKDERRGWGPALDGVQRDNIDYWLTHILDPGAVVPSQFRNSIVELDDGRTLTGCITEETPAIITIRTAGGETQIGKPRLAHRSESTDSVMPTGLLNGLSDAEVRSLFKHLMPAQKK